MRRQNRRPPLKRWVRRTLIGLFVLFDVALLAVLALLFAPAIGPVSDNALYWSVARESGGNLLFGSEGCQRQHDDLWRCYIRDPGASGTLTYRVRLKKDCWTALRLSGPSAEGPMAKRPSACVRLRDQARLLDRGSSNLE